MADIHNFPLVKHLRSEPSSHILGYRRGRLKHDGKGLAFWFTPMSMAIAEVPVDDRDIDFLFTGRTADFQQITVQGLISYRIVDAKRIAERINFAVDLKRGFHIKQPLDQIYALLTGHAQRIGLQHITRFGVRDLLTTGLEEIQDAIEIGLRAEESLTGLGIEIVTARVYELKPTAELEKAIQTPTRETLQQRADEAIFERRALAVEKESAIAENEMKNQIELAKREEQLIAQQGQNGLRQAKEEAEAKRIESLAAAERTAVNADARAGQIRAVEGAKAEAERERLAAYHDVRAEVLVAMGLKEMAGKLEIEHLNITPEMITPLVTRFLETRQVQPPA